jgi:CheY-like chemotaxis protein
VGIFTVETLGQWKYYLVVRETPLLAAARVLVVDDEQLCLEVTSRRLTREGYQVFPASGPRQALEILRNNPPMHLVLSDIHMPEMRGTELVREIARSSPRIASVFMTAFVMHPRDVPKGVLLLKKPFSARDLMLAVQAALERSARIRDKLEHAAESPGNCGARSGQLRSEVKAARLG